MDLDAYLERIQYCGSRRPTLDALRSLQRAHLLSVPFENLSIVRGEEIQLDEDWLFDKIVRRQRGGFCYELNGSFACLLEALGFDVARYEARVWRDSGALGPRWDHLALGVRLDRTYLVDVGFGDSCSQPLDVSRAAWTDDVRTSYRVTRSGADGTLWKRTGERGEASFVYSSNECALADFAPGCEYHQKSPDSFFTQGLVCTRLLADGGRQTLRARQWIETSADGSRSEREVSVEEQADRLHRCFGILRAEL